jgi:DNA topoisomerase-3
MQKLTPPNKFFKEAVSVRQEMDLRIGASFTRFQTLALRQILGPQNKMILSYGPCQFPTLGLVVTRKQAIDSFQESKFWQLKLEIKVGKSKSL